MADTRSSGPFREIEDQSNRQGKQKRIDAVEYSAVSGQQCSGILTPAPRFIRRFHKISHLRGNVDADGEERSRTKRRERNRMERRIAASETVARSRKRMRRDE